MKHFKHVVICYFLISDSVAMTRDKKGLSQLDIKNISGLFLLMNDLSVQYPNVVVFGITNR